jgi:hypothetical protein
VISFDGAWGAECKNGNGGVVNTGKAEVLEERPWTGRENG